MGPTWAKIPIWDPHGSNLGIMPGFCPYGTHMPMRAGKARFWLIMEVGPCWPRQLGYEKFCYDKGLHNSNCDKKCFVSLFLSLKGLSGACT